MEFIKEFCSDRSEAGILRRGEESDKIRKKYPERIPVVVDRVKATDHALVDSRGKEKHKYLVPLDMTVGMFYDVLRRSMPKLKPEDALYFTLYDSRQIPATTKLMSVLYAEHRNPDGYLYFVYTAESTFGFTAEQMKRRRERVKQALTRVDVPEVKSTHITAVPAKTIFCSVRHHQHTPKPIPQVPKPLVNVAGSVIPVKVLSTPQQLPHVTVQTVQIPSPPKSVATLGYKGWDVHAYSGDIRTQLESATKRLVACLEKCNIDTASVSSPEHVEKLLTSISERYTSEGQRQAIANIRANWQTTDRDLNNMPITLLLTATWIEVNAANDPSIWALFGETLQDIGMTCIQGITHRLFALWQSLDESKKK